MAPWSWWWQKFSWWRHQMETFSAVLAICAGNSPVTGEFPAQRPVKRSFDVFFDLCLNKRLSKPWWGWWFETPYDVTVMLENHISVDWSYLHISVWHSMVSWHGYVFCITIPLRWAPTGQRWIPTTHDDVIKWKHFPRNWPFVRGIHRSRWIPHTKASDAELWCFLWSASE